MGHPKKESERRRDVEKAIKRLLPHLGIHPIMLPPNPVTTADEKKHLLTGA